MCELLESVRFSTVFGQQWL